MWQSRLHSWMRWQKTLGKVYQAGTHQQPMRLRFHICARSSCLQCNLREEWCIACRLSEVWAQSPQILANNNRKYLSMSNSMGTHPIHKSDQVPFLTRSIGSHWRLASQVRLLARLNRYRYAFCCYQFCNSSLLSRSIAGQVSIPLKVDDLS